MMPLKLSMIYHGRINSLDKVYQAYITPLKHYLLNIFINQSMFSYTACIKAFIPDITRDEPLRSRPTNPVPINLTAIYL